MSDLEIIDAEIVVSAPEARGSIDRAKAGALTFWHEVKWQVENNAWEALRYESLDQMWDAEYMALNVGIARSDRPELVASFRRAGQTQQQIAEKLNVTERTIKRDTADLISKGHLSPSDITVTNSRGQERPATYAKPAPANVNTDTGEIVPSAAERQAAQDAIAREANAIENVAFMADTLGRLDLLDAPEYRARLIENNTAYPDTENPSYVEHFNPQGIRALADLLNTLATEMETAS